MTRHATNQKGTGCDGAGPTRTASVHLPVLETGHAPRGTIRPSRSGRRRAIVLGVVQLLLVVHVIQWWITGRTTTPIEPSESMEFVKHGVVNVGLLFFGVALLATLVLGRWFCGWGCHVVMLQDLCGWIMKKLGVRPKPFRSRLLLYVPLLLALYMFVWPAVYRWGLVPIDGWLAGWLGAENWLVAGLRTMFSFGGIDLPRQDLPAWTVSWHLTTDSFWQTFAGPAVAIPFLLVCGFATVYFLGAKGFCTYGCPYGGFFAPLDEFAVGRIRVTDACEHCGHCTAVCTSNVRVHEEVREFGMVVDPGCMKCLDCVSVCPNDALYFGFGRPAVHKGAPRHQAPKRLHDLSWPEEIALALVFLLTFISVRGVYGVVPMLFAAGIAGCVTFLAWKGWQLLRRDSVNLLRTRLKYKGSMRGPGWAWATVIALMLLLTAHSGIVNLAEASGEFHYRRVGLVPSEVFRPDAPEPDAATRRHAEQGLRAYGRASWIGAGGLGLLRVHQDQLDFRRAGLLAVLRRPADAEQVMQSIVSRNGLSDALAQDIATVRRLYDSPAPALDWFRQVLLEQREYRNLLADLVTWAAEARQLDPAIAICRERLDRWPDDPWTHLALANLHLAAGAYDPAIAAAQKAVAGAPENVAARRTLASALVLTDRAEEALVQMEEAARLAPDSAAVHHQLALLLQALGRTDEARAHAATAARLESERHAGHGH